MNTPSLQKIAIRELFEVYHNMHSYLNYLFFSETTPTTQPEGMYSNCQHENDFKNSYFFENIIFKFNLLLQRQPHCRRLNLEVSCTSISKLLISNLIIYWL